MEFLPPSTSASTFRRSLNIRNTLVGLLVALCGTLSVEATPVLPTDNTSGPNMAIYGWGLMDTGIHHHAYTSSWLYRSNMWVEDAQGYANWASIEGEPGSLNAASYWLRQHPGGTFYYTVCMLPGSGSVPMAGTSLALGAAASYNSHYQILATRLVAKGLANNTIIRLGHEFNGNWYPWKVLSPADALNFAQYYQQIVQTMKGVPGAENLKFDWNGACSIWTSYPIANAYPGDTYVDYIGADVYDQCYAANTYPYPAGSTPAQILTRQQTAWTSISANYNNGLAVWKNFAAAHGKPLTIPEWGVVNRTDNGGGLDNPDYIQQMYNFIQDPANNVYFHSYFDVQARDGHHQLTNLPGYGTTEFPNAALAFRRLFGLPPLPINDDIGTVGVSGSNGVVSVTGAGTGCLTTGTSDNFHLASRITTGDDSLIVQISSTNTGTALQYGLMLRQSAAANSAYAALLISNGNCLLQSRPTTGAAAVTNATLPAVTTPAWMKMTRSGTLVTAYESADGLNWNYVGSPSVAITGTASFGVAVSSGSTTGLNTVNIDDVGNFNIPVASTGSISNGIVLDDTSATGVTKTGTWTSTTSPATYYGTTYLHDGNTGKGTKSVRFSPTLPAAGEYDVYGYWITGYNCADNVPISVISMSGTTQKTGNQTIGTYLWNHLGTYNFATGTSGSVLISNAATNGYTIADAVMFVPRPTTPPSGNRDPLIDAYVQDGTSAATNYGAATVLALKKDAVNFNRDSYLKFDVSGLATAPSVKLWITPDVIGSDAATTTVVFETVADNSWTETGLNWNNKPASSGAPIATITGGFAVGTPILIDVTSEAQAAAAGSGILSIRIYATVPGSQRYINFGSRENANTSRRPLLQY